MRSAITSLADNTDWFQLDSMSFVPWFSPRGVSHIVLLCYLYLHHHQQIYLPLHKITYIQQVLKKFLAIHEAASTNRPFSQ